MKEYKLMKRLSSLSIAAPIALLLMAAAPKVFSDDHDQKTIVTIDQAIQVPGAVLQPGTYMFILLNSTSNRNIIEVKSTDGKQLYSMSFATRAMRVFPTDNVTLTFYEMPQGSPPAVRQWYVPGAQQGQEFLYSHQEAANITAASHQTVPEVTDQEASSLNSQAPAASTSTDQTASVKQSDESVQQSAAVTDQQPAQQIADQPVQSPAQTDQSISAQSLQQDQVVAQANPPADTSSNVTVAQNYAQTYTPPAPAAQSTPDNSSDNNDNASLPKTASDLPLVGLVGLVSLAGAVTLRLARGRA
jgi:hypothetical protein